MLRLMIGRCQACRPAVAQSRLGILKGAVHVPTSSTSRRIQRRWVSEAAMDGGGQCKEFDSFTMMAALGGAVGGWLICEPWANDWVQPGAAWKACCACLGAASAWLTAAAPLRVAALESRLRSIAPGSGARGCWLVFANAGAGIGVRAFFRGAAFFAGHVLASGIGVLFAHTFADGGFVGSLQSLMMAPGAALVAVFPLCGAAFVTAPLWSVAAITMGVSGMVAGLICGIRFQGASAKFGFDVALQHVLGQKRLDAHLARWRAPLARSFLYSPLLTVCFVLCCGQPTWMNIEHSRFVPAEAEFFRAERGDQSVMDRAARSRHKFSEVRPGDGG